MSWLKNPLKTLADVERFESEMPLLERLSGDSIYDVFVEAAQAHGDRTALRMLVTGADDEQARRVNYEELLGLVRQAANLFCSLGGARPGIAYMLPNLVETHAVLWGAETAGYAVPINFLLQPDHIRGLIEASEVKVLDSIYQEQVKEFRAQPDKAKIFLEVGDSKRNEALDQVEHAAWTVIGNLMLNLDEVLIRG